MQYIGSETSAAMSARWQKRHPMLPSIGLLMFAATLAATLNNSQGYQADKRDEYLGGFRLAPSRVMPSVRNAMPYSHFRYDSQSDHSRSGDIDSIRGKRGPRSHERKVRGFHRPRGGWQGSRHFLLQRNGRDFESSGPVESFKRFIGYGVRGNRGLRGSYKVPYEQSPNYRADERDRSIQRLDYPIQYRGFKRRMRRDPNATSKYWDTDLEGDSEGNFRNNFRHFLRQRDKRAFESSKPVGDFERSISYEPMRRRGRRGGRRGPHGRGTGFPFGRDDRTFVNVKIWTGGSARRRSVEGDGESFKRISTDPFDEHESVQRWDRPTTDEGFKRRIVHSNGAFKRWDSSRFRSFATPSKENFFY